MNMKAEKFGVVFLICQICGVGAFAQQINLQKDAALVESRIPVVPGSKGDVDGNSFIEIFDLLRARDIAIGRLSNPGPKEVFAADLNSNGAVSRDDVEKIRDV